MCYIIFSSPEEVISVTVAHHEKLNLCISLKPGLWVIEVQIFFYLNNKFLFVQCDGPRKGTVGKYSAFVVC